MTKVWPQKKDPGFFWPPLVIASVCGELGRKAEAASAVNELLAIDPILQFMRAGTSNPGTMEVD